jgi:hypothetical protein
MNRLLLYIGEMMRNIDISCNIYYKSPIIYYISLSQGLKGNTYGVNINVCDT